MTAEQKLALEKVMTVYRFYNGAVMVFDLAGEQITVLQASFAGSDTKRRFWEDRKLLRAIADAASHHYIALWEDGAIQRFKLPKQDFITLLNLRKP